MFLTEQITIDAPPEAIWQVITDIENATERISGIEKIEVLEKPDDGFVGFKWRETRTMFGKTATEVMWIAEAVENDFYKARAESHGCVYISSMSITDKSDGSCTLAMSHETQPQTFVAKLFAGVLGFMLKSALRKVIRQDLEDIKAAVESRRSEATA